MTAETTSGPAWETPGGPAELGPARRPGYERMVRYGVWVAVVMRTLGDRRFQVRVITGALGAYALGGLIKNNQAQPVRRAGAWYGRLGASNEPAARSRNVTSK